MDGFDFNTSMLDNFFLTEQDLEITSAPSLFPTTNTSHNGSSFIIDPFSSSPAIPNSSSESSFHTSRDEENYLQNSITELPQIPIPEQQHFQQQQTHQTHPNSIHHRQGEDHRSHDPHEYIHQTIDEQSQPYTQYHRTTDESHDAQTQPYTQYHHTTDESHDAQTQPYTQYHYHSDVRGVGAAEHERRVKPTATKPQTSADGVKRRTKRPKQGRADQSNADLENPYEPDPFSQKDGGGQQNDSQGGLPAGKMLLPSRLQTLAMISLDKKREPVDEETEKRERNCAASARFRKKKREEQLETERQAQQMKARYDDLRARKEKLLAEKEYLEELLALKEEKEERENGEEHDVVVIP